MISRWQAPAAHLSVFDALDPKGRKFCKEEVNEPVVLAWRAGSADEVVF